MHVDERRLYCSVFVLYYRYVVIDNYVLPYIFLVDLEDIDSIGIHVLIFEYFLQKSRAAHYAVQSPNEIILRVAFLRLCDLKIAFEGLGKREFPVLEEISNPHPRNFLSDLLPSLLALEKRGVDRREDLVLVFVRTRYSLLLRGVVVHRPRKPVPPCVVASGFGLQLAENGLVLLLDNLIGIILVGHLLPFVAVLA